MIIPGVLSSAGAGPFAFVNTEAEDYYARLGGTYSGTQKGAIDNWFTAVKVSPGLAKFDAVYFRFLQTSADALLNVISTSYDSTIVGDCPFTAGQGFRTDGVAGSYLDNNFNPTTAVTPKYVQDSAHRFGWKRFDAIDKALLGVVLTFTSYIFPKFSDGQRYVRNNNITDIAATTANAAGMWTTSRLDSAEFRNYQDDTLRDTAVLVSTGVEDSNFCDLGTGGSQPFADVSFMSGFGSGLTTGEVEDLWAANRALLTAFGIVVGAGGGGGGPELLDEDDLALLDESDLPLVEE